MGEEKRYQTDETFENEEKTYTSGVFMTAINITNVIIGSGIITLPISFSDAGLGLAIIVMTVSACLAHYTLLCLAKQSEITGLLSYQDILQDSLGLTGYIIISICCIIYPLFAVLSYGIIIGGNFQNIFSFLAPNVPVLSNKLLIVGVSMFLIVFPLTMFRNVAFLDKMSLVSIICVVYYFFVVIAMAAYVPQTIFLFPKSLVFGRHRIAQSISVIAFALSCHQTIPPIYKSQKDRSVKNFAKSSYLAITFATIVYILIGSVGYLSFPGIVDGNLLENYCPDDKVITSARILFSLTVILSSPLQLFTSREAITNIIYRYTKFNWYIHTLVTFTLVAIVFGVSTQFTDLGLVVGISGALIGSVIVFVLPAASLYIGLKQGWVPNTKTKIMCLIIFVLGVFLVILGVIMNIIDSGAVHRIRYWCDSLVNTPTTGIITEDELKTLIKISWNNLSG